MERCVCNRLYCHVSQSITSLKHEFMLSRLCSSQLFGEAPNKKQTDRYFVFWLCHGFRHSRSRHSFWKAEKVRCHWSTERLVFRIPKGQITESCGWWHSLWTPTGLFRCSPGQSCWPTPLCDIYQCVDMLTVSEKRRGGGGGPNPLWHRDDVSSSFEVLPAIRLNPRVQVNFILFRSFKPQGWKTKQMLVCSKYRNTWEYTGNVVKVFFSIRSTKGNVRQWKETDFGTRRNRSSC